MVLICIIKSKNTNTTRSQDPLGQELSSQGWLYFFYLQFSPHTGSFPLISMCKIYFMRHPCHRRKDYKYALSSQSNSKHLKTDFLDRGPRLSWQHFDWPVMDRSLTGPSLHHSGWRDLIWQEGIGGKPWVLKLKNRHEKQETCPYS